MESKEKLLLHSCCGPCSAGALERLLREYDITVFFYNPNVTDSTEYGRRREAQITCIEAFNREVLKGKESNQVGYVEGPYEPQAFFKTTMGMEDEPEGGRRCIKCFRLRLLKTAKVAAEMGFKIYGTTLSISPHKNYDLLCKIGNQVLRYEEVGCQELQFLKDDLKKKDGFTRSVQLAKKFNLYRQNYCGCDFSRPRTANDP
ncbi:MAG: epoxyqueuosine reductase QueH [Anaerovoracaceae bacterium]|jgi:predicted adenine nucleotide alpha hydrolase (AANH) superfamily ATPase